MGVSQPFGYMHSPKDMEAIGNDANPQIFSAATTLLYHIQGIYQIFWSSHGFMLHHDP